MKTIALIQTANAWFADFGNDAEILALFGSTILPTAFSHDARYADVRARIQQINPGYEVL
jgi:hypothetical protein